MQEKKNGWEDVHPLCLPDELQKAIKAETLKQRSFQTEIHSQQSQKELERKSKMCIPKHTTESHSLNIAGEETHKNW